MKLRFKGKTVELDEQKWDVEYPIHDARLIEETVVIIYEYMSGPGHRQFRNLEAFDLQGKKLWTAEHPSNMTADVYVDFQKEKPLTLWNFGCYICEIDLANGKLLKAQFTK